ncbi:DnaT-like ssDNA-binding domain-containing protein [Citrobacter braakii]|uniref:DnaT-like ssDNA-binding domain-containing protein n=1 Tax=Citrobacter braakii TaxID=57706 RepID=UPI0040397EC0
MARIRAIKPEFWTNEDLSAVSESACLLAIGLMNYADDEGYFNANPLLIKAAIFPIRETSGTVPVLLRELSNCGYIEQFSGSDKKLYGRIVNFTKHQVINKAKPSKIKELGLIPYNYGTENVLIPPGKEGKGKDQGKEERESNAHESSVDNFAGEPPNPPPEPEEKKFRMHPDWQPMTGFVERAEGWGHPLGGVPPTDAEIRQFRDYWQPETAHKHHLQWEMALAESLERQRSGKRPHQPQRDINVTGPVDKKIPDGFRGSNPHLDET